jgi:hypothetical protein
MEQDKFVSSHDGVYIRHGGKGIRNSYEIWEDKDQKSYVKMKVLKNGEELQTLFDYTDLKKIKDEMEIHGTWSITGNGYVMNSSTKQYLHHLVMDFKSTGRGFQEQSIDHINRDPLDNRKSNLRLATAKEQQENSKGRIDDTKRERQVIAQKLPTLITQDMMPRYVNYRSEKYKQYFVIEEHPVYTNGITINGKHIGKTIKSVQAQWIDQYADPKEPYPIESKLNEIKLKCQLLNEVYELYKKTNEKNIIIEESPILLGITEAKIAKNTKTVYKYDPDFNLVAEYDSIVNAAKANNISDKTINRVKRSGAMCQGYYYRIEQIEL